MRYNSGILVVKIFCLTEFHRRNRNKIWPHRIRIETWKESEREFYEVSEGEDLFAINGKKSVLSSAVVEKW